MAECKNPHKGCISRIESKLINDLCISEYGCIYKHETEQERNESKRKKEKRND